MGCLRLTYDLKTTSKTEDTPIFGRGEKQGSDYYLFGMQMPGRKDEGDGDYRYGFQGQEMDDEVKGRGNSVNYKYRMHDPRVGRFFAVDPLAPDYPHNSPYAFSENKVIQFVELEGLEVFLSKAQRAEYGGGMWSDVGTFLFNSGVSLYNGFADAFNYAGELDKIDKEQGTVFGTESVNKLKSDVKQAVDGVHNYVTTTTYEKFKEDAINVLSDVETYEDIAGAILGGTVTKGTRMLSSTALINTRKSLATAFYQKSGYTGQRAANHIGGINFEKAVQTKTLKKGTVVQQWVGEDGVGNYFTPLENGASKNLGISYEGRTLKQFTLTEDVKVLQSTAANVGGASGGGTQYFSPNLKNNITVKE